MCDEIKKDEISEDKANYTAKFCSKLLEGKGIEIDVDGSPEELLALISVMVHFYSQKVGASVASTLLMINEGIESVFVARENANEVQHTVDGV